MTVAHVTHRLRHVIKQLVGYTADEVGNSEAVRELAGYGCLARMHVVRLLAPRVDKEDHTKDVDFSPAGIRQIRVRSWPVRAFPQPTSPQSSLMPKFCLVRQWQADGARMNGSFWHFSDMVSYMNESSSPRESRHWRTIAAGVCLWLHVLVTMSVRFQRR